MNFLWELSSRWAKSEILFHSVRYGMYVFDLHSVQIQISLQICAVSEDSDKSADLCCQCRFRSVCRFVLSVRFRSACKFVLSVKIQISLQICAVSEDSDRPADLCCQ